MSMPAEIPDVVGTVRGYRVWSLLYDGTLKAAVHGHQWRPGLNVARCLVSSWHLASDEKARPWMRHDEVEPIPVEGCKCGFWAAASPYSRAIPYGVFGVVDMSGGIVEHKKNTVIRSGKATIVAVCMPRVLFTPEQIAKVRAKYPDTRIFRSRRAMLRAFPPSLNSEQKKRAWRGELLRPATAGLQLNAAFWNIYEVADGANKGASGDFALALGSLFFLSAVAWLAHSQGLLGSIGATAQFVRRWRHR